MIPKFSIIVPFHNVEKYIGKCVESLQNQTFDDFEAIFVDDGSQDHSLEIVEKLIDGSEKYKIIRCQNSGVSAARNQALKVAKGKFIWFIDSDDWIVHNALDILDAKISDDIDFLGFSNFHFLEDQNKQNDNHINDDSGIISKNEIYQNKFKFETAPWIYIFNHDFLVKNNLSFREDIRLHEDEFFLADCLVNANKIKFISDKLYYHRIRQGSLMRTKNFQAKFYAFSELNKIYQKYRKNQEGSFYWEKKLYGIAIVFYQNYFHLDLDGKASFKDYYSIFQKTKLRKVTGENQKIAILKLMHNHCFPVFKYFLLK